MEQEDHDDDGINHMDLQMLPEGCIANAISLTTPPDACRLSTVSKGFKSAAESDDVWNRFLPPDIHSILSLPPDHCPSTNQSKKGQYLALCDNPVLIDQGSMSFSLDKWSGKKCYMISARKLQIVWGDTPQYWTWKSLPDSRFEEVAELRHVCWLEIRGRISTRLLSPSTLYKAYLVFKFNEQAYGFKYQLPECTVGLVGGEDPNALVGCLYDGRGHIDQDHLWQRHFPIEPRQADRYPKERVDGWLELELGEFFCEEGSHGDDLEMSCLEVKGGHWKRGLIVEGIEIRLVAACRQTE